MRGFTLALKDMATSLSRRLADARRDHTTLDALTPAQIPASADAAYAIQHEILNVFGARIGGWKIGAKSDSGPVQGAPLPHVDLHADGARLRRKAFAPLGLELEIAFRFGRRFDPSATPYGEAEVRAGIGSIGATIEIVASRYAAWPDVDKLAQLARGREFEPFDRSLDVQISRLRKMIESDPSQPRYIQTVWGVGYVFVPDGAN